MSKDFGTQFLRGFFPASQQSYAYAERNRMMREEEERKKNEQLKAQQEQQGILSQLMTGTKPTLNYAGKYAPLLQQDVPINDNQKFGLYSKLTPQNQNAYEYWQKQNAPDYNAPILQKDNKTIVRWNNKTGQLEDTGQPNPFYEEQLLEGSEFVPATSIKGLEKWKGYTVERKVWTDKDGNIVKYGGVGNPIKPTYKEHKGKKVYSLSNYQEKTGVFAKREADLNSKITKYKSENIIDIDAYNKGEEKIGTYGNAINKAYDKEEIAFYNDMIPDARNYVNKHFYQPLKESGMPEESVYSDRQGIYQDYEADLIDNYKEGNIDIDLNNYEIPEGVDPATFAKDVEAEVFKSALLWGKLKLRRL